MTCTIEREPGEKPTATLSSMTFSDGRRVVLEPPGHGRPGGSEQQR